MKLLPATVLLIRVPEEEAARDRQGRQRRGRGGPLFRRREGIQAGRRPQRHVHSLSTIAASLFNYVTFWVVVAALPLGVAAAYHMVMRPFPLIIPSALLEEPMHKAFPIVLEALSLSAVARVRRSVNPLLPLLCLMHARYL